MNERRAPSRQRATETATPAVAQAPRVRVRTYRHGLGDCHLLSFARSDRGFFHILIDCGVVNRTENPGPLMTAVAADIARETGGMLDVIVATHQHTDHLSGFHQARAEFRRIGVKELWLAWMEDRSNPLARRIQEQLAAKLAAVRTAAVQLARLDHEAAPRVAGILDFFGAAADSPGGTQAILDGLQQRRDLRVSYLDPGTTLSLPGVGNLRVHVLGPPTDVAALKVTNPRKSRKEGYEEAEFAAELAGFVEALELPSEDKGHPFARRHRRAASAMRRSSFFRRHYLGRDPDDGTSQKWRRIDQSWLEVSEKLALALNEYTNNTSLALAFEFAETGEVLLFPGDAQIGSWLTWSEMTWTLPGEARSVGIKDLLARTVFYKASHHASHNGTLSGLGPDACGLEQMTSRDLVCVVPVDREMSRRMRWDRTLPWRPLLDRLAEKCRGRVVLTDRAEAPPAAASLAALTPAERQQFAARVTVTGDWIEYRL